MSTELDSFYSTLQKACLPGVWSKGVSLSRASAVSLDSFSEKEIILRVKTPEKSVALKVSLWPEDEDYFCDCEDRADPCAHVAAAVAALKTGLKMDTASAAGIASRSAIQYRLLREGESLRLERSVGGVPLEESLISRVGAIESGRITGPRIDATQDDLAVDYALGDVNTASVKRPLDAKALPKIFSSLKNVGGLSFEGDAVTIGKPLQAMRAELRDDFQHGEKGFRLVVAEAPELASSPTEFFKNGAVRIGDTLRILLDPGLTSAEREMLTPPGRRFGPAEIPKLLSDILPALEQKITVDRISTKVPELSDAPPEVKLRLERRTGPDGIEVLSVIPAIAYAAEFYTRDENAEKQLLRKLQSELQMTPGHRVEFRENAAIEFLKNTRGWHFEDLSKTTSQSGNGAVKNYFTPEPVLSPNFEVSADDFRLNFRAPSGKLADPAQVLQAWRENERYVRLLDGGYAPLPRDWLARFGPRIQRLLDMRAHAEGKLPAFLKPELLTLMEDSGTSLSDSLLKLKAAFNGDGKIPDAKLPSDLRAELRAYQRMGVNWLNFLRTSDMGALLADDMGLGKTLQAICSFSGRTLVVCPTSVLSAWSEQMAKFRPGLKVSLFYGANRKLDRTADVLLTSYGLLRSDRDLLLSEKFGTVVLDEAQTIKNPDSQVAKAAHALRAPFRIALSGTPVENRLEDLWSQFRFLNPGLLGTLSEFRESFTSPISRGDPAASERLASIIRPFILRRMKKEVAPELPPRTEVVLHAELSKHERELYDALLATSRKEILAQLDAGGSVFGALEQLLRLRQACCHPALVPGEKADHSAKLSLLMDTLEESIAMGHRSLVFSQWTSFLDLIEKPLTEKGITFLRLDGSTRDRAEVVSKFQSREGPSVLLISLKAGGTGLTLTAADHVFLMDSWWNPAVEDQAADRAHRIGQENPVLIHRLIAKDTVEEKILALQNQKKELSTSVLSGSGNAASLTREDLTAFLN